MANDIWTGSGQWNVDTADWSLGAPPTSSDNVEISTGSSNTLVGSGSADALTIDVGGTLSLSAGASLTTALFLKNAGNFNVTADGETVSIGGWLVNTGTTAIGNSSLGASTIVTAKGLSNSGTLIIQGNAAATKQAELNITGAAPSSVTGLIQLGGDALLQFASGGFTNIQATGSLELDGAQARVRTNSGASNGLANLWVNYGALLLRGASALGAGGASLSTTTSFTNYGSFSADSNTFDGGSSASFGGTFVNAGAATIGNSSLAAATIVTATGLTNSGALNILGNSDATTTGLAELNITGAAPANVNGKIQVAGDALLQFASGGFANILSAGRLELDGANAHILTNSGAGNGLANLSYNGGALVLRGNSSIGAGGATLTTTTFFSNYGTLSVDATAGDGGSSARFGGTFANIGTANIGNSSLIASTIVTATALTNSGALYIIGNAGATTANQAELKITGAAPPNVNGRIQVAGDALLQFASGGFTTIRSGGSLELDGAKAHILTNSGAANGLANLSSNSGALLLRGASALGAGGSILSTTTSFANAGTFNVDPTGGDGGSSAILGGTFTNSGAATIGNSSLSASTNVTATGLANSGALNILGNKGAATTIQAELNITGAAPAIVNGRIQVAGDALLQFASGGFLNIQSGGWLELDGAKARVLTNGGAANGLANLSSSSGTLLLRGASALGAGGAILSTSTSFTNAGTFNVDQIAGDGGSSARFGGTFTNSGAATIGNSSLSASTNVTATGLTNSGALNILGNAGATTANQAELNITGAAPGSVSGRIQIAGDALLQFASGVFTTILSGGWLELDGAKARILTNSGATSVLPSLALNYGTLQLRGGSTLGAGGVTISTTPAFTNYGTFKVDPTGGDGGSSVRFGGTFTNAGAATIGNSNSRASTNVTATSLANSGSLILQGNASATTANQAELNIIGAAPSGVSGKIQVAGDALLQFASGGFVSVQAGASLELDGAKARVLTNSGLANALAALSSNYGALLLRGRSFSLGAGGASLSTTTSFANYGTFKVDSTGGDGGSSVSFGGTFTNTGAANIGNSALSAPTIVTATSLNNSGALILQGNASATTTNQATLNIAGAAPSSVNGKIQVAGDALLQFASGSIASVQPGGWLELDGAKARVLTNSGAANGLAGLALNYGTLLLRGDSTLGAGGTILSTATAFTNYGTFNVDPTGNANPTAGDGGSSASFAGAFTNMGVTDIGNSSLRAAATVTAKSLNNSGSLILQGNAGATTTSQAELNITGAAPAAVAGNIRLSGDALLQFVSGGFASVQAGAQLELDGANARVLTNSGFANGLSGLATNNGVLLLRGGSSYGAGGAKLSTTSSFTNAGTFSVDPTSGDGGSSASFGGAFTNTGAATIGDSNLSAATTVTATGLNNSGALTLQGNGAASKLAELIVNGAASNTGTINVGTLAEIDVTGTNAFNQNGGVTTINGSLVANTVNANGGLLDFASAITSGDGLGALNIGANGELEVGAGIDASHSIQFLGSTGQLDLNAPTIFAATIKGFAGHDAIDLLGKGVTGMAFAGGVLTVNLSGGGTANLAMSGSYTTASFTTQSDGAGGTYILHT